MTFLENAAIHLLGSPRSRMFLPAHHTAALPITFPLSQWLMIDRLLDSGRCFHFFFPGFSLSGLMMQLFRCHRQVAPICYGTVCPMQRTFDAHRIVTFSRVRCRRLVVFVFSSRWPTLRTARQHHSRIFCTFKCCATSRAKCSSCVPNA